MKILIEWCAEHIHVAIGIGVVLLVAVASIVSAFRNSEKLDEHDPRGW